MDVEASWGRCDFLVGLRLVPIGVTVGLVANGAYYVVLMDVQAYFSVGLVDADLQSVSELLDICHPESRHLHDDDTVRAPHLLNLLPWR